MAKGGGGVSVEVNDKDLNDKESNEVNESGFSWENRYAQSWEILREDSAGTLQPTLSLLVQRESEYLHRRRIAADTALRRGIMRHIVLLLDWSIAAASTEVTPNRAVWMVNFAIRPLIRDFFEQNPLGQVSLVTLKDGLAEIISELSPNSSQHNLALDQIVQTAIQPEGAPRGSLSIQNGLQVAQSILKHTPGHGTREVLLFQIGLASHDPGNIFDILPGLKAAKIRTSAISLYGEVSVIRLLTKETDGTYSVAVNDSHFGELSKEQLTPPVTSRDSKATSYLVPMGFPTHINYKTAVLCACHGELRLEGFQCPHCHSLTCQLPIDCPICKLTLISAPHLAKSYHYLFPVSNYLEIDGLTGKCFACSGPIIPNENVEGYRSGQCHRCKDNFCAQCNYTVHSLLYNCPGCLK